MITFLEWRKKIKEMAGTGAVIGSGHKKQICNAPDYNVWGAFCNGVKKKVKRNA